MTVLNARSALRIALQDTPPGVWLKHRYDFMVLRRWQRAGRACAPPHAFKRNLVRSAGRALGLRQLVETGTFYGDMVAAAAEHFAAITSIELDPRLHQLALRRFRDLPHVQLMHGDSGALLPRILDSLHEPTLFWLDAHFSGPRTAQGSTETPILTELLSLLSTTSGPHTILVDDARCFDGTHDYPTIASLRDLVSDSGRGRYTIAVANDIIRILPQCCKWNGE